jgi:phosphatidate phosphatase APP1
MTRKNRLILSLARQITKYNSNVAATEAMNQFSSDKLKQETFSDSDSDTLSESSSIDDYVSPSSNPNSVSTDDLIKERLASFIARSIPNAELTIVIGSHDVHEKVYTKNIVTDDGGRFDEHIVVPYKPSVVQLKASTDDSIFSFQDISLVPNQGIGLISDIDDTVKLTGVIGDKRKLMATLLLNEVALWKIPPVISWYDSLYKTRGVSFHYVSNSPWQLFGAINQYFKESKLPAGSMHLKQYTGNILSSLTEPSSSRKKTALSKILKDFSEKQFICVGDSGEHDLEAYVDLAKSYPNRVLAIYIRYVENSLSDVDENKVWWEIEKILHEYNGTMKQKDVILKTENGHVSNDIEDLIDLADAEPKLSGATDRQAKLPPMVPKKTFKFERKPTSTKTTSTRSSIESFKY